MFTIFAPLIINLLYGVEYEATVPVLQILTRYRAFSFMGTIRNILLLAEEKQKFLPFINIVGVVLNVILNALVIPILRACGAALASLITHMAMNFVLGFGLKPIKYNNVLMLKASSRNTL